MMLFRTLVGAVLFGGLLCAQTPADVIRVGPGVTMPRLLHKEEPEYSALARADHVQGDLVVQIVVNEAGRATEATILSPLGYGLDEQALAAIDKWRFAPGTKDGKPVKILATVEVHFRFPDIWFDAETERQRTLFNTSLHDLNTKTSQAIQDRAVKSMSDLSKKGLPPAMYLVGTWEINGDHVAKDQEAGLKLILKAAAKNHGPAIYEIAIRQIKSQGLPQDVEAGLEKMRQAAMLGSVQAQYYLGNRYEKGDGVPADASRARRYFRLCSAQGIPECQYKLGSLLLRAVDRPERDYVQAVAYLQLASEKGLDEPRVSRRRRQPSSRRSRANGLRL